MTEPRHRFSRQQLYDEIWARPAVELAAELGISSVALKKICKKHEIPTPERGYWARKNAGYSMPQSSLPAVDDPSLNSVLIFGMRASRSPSKPIPPAPPRTKEDPFADKAPAPTAPPVQVPVAAASGLQEVSEVADLDRLELPACGLSLGGTVDCAAAIHALKLANERAEGIRREREQLEEQRRQELEEARRQLLDQLLEKFECMAQLEDFVAALEADIIQAGPRNDLQLSRFVAWARTRIASLRRARSPDWLRKELIQRCLFPPEFPN